MTAVERAIQVVASKFEGCGEAWSDRHSGDSLAYYASVALDQAGLLLTDADRAVLDAADVYITRQDHDIHEADIKTAEAFGDLVHAVRARRKVES